ncbi:hypothetical protein M9Y34_11145, partial [Acinetobacter baumannii]|nr:hypothetical protein [Acinetobacter baumannii]
SLIHVHNTDAHGVSWLAVLIEHSTEGHSCPPPPIEKCIPEYMSFKSELDFLPLNEEKIQNEGKEITDYFNSKLYKATFKK